MIIFNYLSKSDDIIRFENRIKSWVQKTISLETKKFGEIAYTICDDEYLLKINQKFLNHDTYTDIITFPTSNHPNIISGEIYISLTRIIENAKQHKCTLWDEYSRVLIHGVLHLIGYDDHSTEDKLIMRAKEDYYLTLRT